jgi:hypothetical protein
MGIGHSGHSRKPACRCCCQAGRNSFFILKSWLTEVRMHVNETWGDNTPPRLYNSGCMLIGGSVCLGHRRAEINAYVGNFAFDNPDIEMAVYALVRINHPPASDQDVHPSFLRQ